MKGLAEVIPLSFLPPIFQRVADYRSPPLPLFLKNLGRCSGRGASKTTRFFGADLRRRRRLLTFEKGGGDISSADRRRETTSKSHPNSKIGRGKLLCLLRRGRSTLRRGILVKDAIAQRAKGEREFLKFKAFSHMHTRCCCCFESERTPPASLVDTVYSQLFRATLNFFSLVVVVGGLSP